jgi:hypothetical protein
MFVVMQLVGAGVGLGLITVSIPEPQPTTPFWKASDDP